MAKTRKVPFTNGQYYHIYNRGVDKRNIFGDIFDLQRFIQSMIEFNTINPVGSIFENRFKKEKILLGGLTAKLVNFICYALNPNHFHFILEQVADNGISEFMRRLGGYTWYFNNKYKRTGSLFQGKFKDIHIDSNAYLTYLSVYNNLNARVHLKSLGGKTAKIPELTKSSWDEYLRAKIIKNKNGDNILKENPGDICSKSIVLTQFNTIEEYKNFAELTLKSIREGRYSEEFFDLDSFLLEE